MTTTVACGRRPAGRSAVALAVVVALVCGPASAFRPCYQPTRKVAASLARHARGVALFGKGSGKRAKEIAQMASGAPIKPSLGAMQTVPKADAVVAKIFAECDESKARDVGKIMRLCQSAAEVASEKGFEAFRSKRLQGDWQLAYVSSDDGLCAIGSGLHKMPLTRAEDVFVTLSDAGDIETAEILRVIGPFPNVRNTLAGSFATAGDTTVISYDSMIDGLGSTIKTPDGAQTRRVNMKIGYVNDDALILFPMPEGTAEDTPVADLRDVLVFKREPDLDGQFIRLRVERA